MLELQAIETKAQTWFTALSPHFIYTTETFLWHARLESGMAFIFTHILYHASLAVLYYSLVLSYPGDRRQSSTILSVSVLTTSALNHANELSRVFQDLLGPSWDISRTDGFWAYIAYIATTVQIPYLWSRSPDTTAIVRQNVDTNLRFLKELGPYWAVADQLVLSLP